MENYAAGTASPFLKCRDRMGLLQRKVKRTSSSNQLLRRVFLITGFLVQRTGILIPRIFLLNKNSPLRITYRFNRSGNRPTNLAGVEADPGRRSDRSGRPCWSLVDAGTLRPQRDNEIQSSRDEDCPRCLKQAPNTLCWPLIGDRVLPLLLNTKMPRGRYFMGAQVSPVVLGTPGRAVPRYDRFEIVRSWET